MHTIPTLSDLLDAAQELEEKGDRYKDGPKALRFYQRASEMYSQANQLEPDLLDVLYNW